MTPPPPTVPGCALSEDALSGQAERYRTLARFVIDAHADLDGVQVTFDERLDRALLHRTLAIERRCCPFLRVELDERERRLRVSVSAPEHRPALRALAGALGLTAPAPRAPRPR